MRERERESREIEKMSDNGVKYVSPHPPGNFHAIRDQPKLDGNLLGRAATSSTLMLGEIVDAGTDAKWGKILDLLDAKTKLHDGVESKDVLVGAWIMIKNGDTILLRPDESSEKVEESSPVAQKRPSDISTPWATPFHKKESVTEEEELDENAQESEDVVVKSLNFEEKSEEEVEEKEETPTETTTTSTESNEEKEEVVEKVVETVVEKTEKPENTTETMIKTVQSNVVGGIDEGSFTGSKGYDLSWMNDPDAFPDGAVPSIPKATSSKPTKKKKTKKKGPPAGLLKRLERKTIPQKKDESADETNKNTTTMSKPEVSKDVPSTTTPESVPTSAPKPQGTSSHTKFHSQNFFKKSVAVFLQFFKILKIFENSDFFKNTQRLQQKLQISKF